MASLQGTKIKDTYPGLIKIEDNGTVQPTVLKTLTDGSGGTLPLSVSQVETKFTSGSLVDFTGTTVTGLSFAAGLVSGTGTDSLKQADTLTTNAATASGLQSISLGNGAQATNNQSIAIGNFAESTSVGTAAIGEYASASGLYASAWGRTANAASDGAVAFGQQTNVPFNVPGGVALGRQVAADLADTTHVRALKIVAPDGGTGGNGITLLSPNGTSGEVTLTNASELALDGTPIGGGGGSSVELAEGQGITPCINPNSYSIPWVLSGYGQTAAKAMFANRVQYVPFYAKAGEAIGEFYVRVSTAVAGSTMNIGLYKGYVSTATGNKTIMPEFVATIATGVSTATTGKKLVTGLDITLPADAAGGLYWLAFQNDTSSVYLTKWSSWVAAERQIYSDIYRGTGVEKQEAEFTLPSGQLDFSTGTTSTTDLPVDFAWKYKS